MLKLIERAEKPSFKGSFIEGVRRLLRAADDGQMYDDRPKPKAEAAPKVSSGQSFYGVTKAAPAAAPGEKPDPRLERHRKLMSPTELVASH